MSKHIPLKRRCANNYCTRNAQLGERLCRKHTDEARKARDRKYNERKAIESFRLANGVRVA